MRACKPKRLLSRVIALLLSALLLPVPPGFAIAPKSPYAEKPEADYATRPVREDLTDEAATTTPARSPQRRTPKGAHKLRSAIGRRSYCADGRD